MAATERDLREAPVHIVDMLEDAANYCVGTASSAELNSAATLLKQLFAALRPRVAKSFDEADALYAQGIDSIWCKADKLNPCWRRERDVPITWPLRHWSYGPGVEGECLACEDCRIRAAMVGAGAL